MTDKKPNSNDDSQPTTGRFESDSQKAVRKHLEDKDHVISEEDIKNVRIGMSPPPNAEPDRDLEELIEKVEEEEKEKPSDDPITPWDALSH